MNWSQLDTVLEVVNKLKATNSNKDKLAILKSYIGHEDEKMICKVLNYTYDTFKKYGISEQVYEGVNVVSNSIFSDTFEMFDKLSSSNINDLLRLSTKSYIENQVPSEYRELIKGILFKDLKIGVNAKSINKVWKGLVPEFNVQLAESLSKVGFKHVENKNIYVTPKMDGFRCIYAPSNKIFLSRKGQEFEGVKHLVPDCERLISLIREKTGKTCILDGELVHEYVEGKNSLDLYSLTSSIARKKGEHKDKKRLVYHVFDVIPEEEFLKGKTKWKYSNRRELLEEVFSSYSFEKVIKVPLLFYGVGTEERITELLERVETEGGEGLMINLDCPYETKRTKSLLKVKSFLDAEVYVTDVYEGTGKHKGKLGGLEIIFKYKKQEYSCQLGSGFSDEERIYYWSHPEEIIGKVIEIQLFEVSRNSQSGDYGLRFPTWKARIRSDKDYEDITELG